MNKKENEPNLVIKNNTKQVQFFIYKSPTKIIFNGDSEIRVEKSQTFDTVKTENQNQITENYVGEAKSTLVKQYKKGANLLYANYQTTIDKDTRNQFNENPSTLTLINRGEKHEKELFPENDASKTCNFHMSMRQRPRKKRVFSPQGKLKLTISRIKRRPDTPVGFPLKIWRAVNDSYPLFNWTRDGRAFTVCPEHYNGVVRLVYPGFGRVRTFDKLRQMLLRHGFSCRKADGQRYMFAHARFVANCREQLRYVRLCYQNTTSDTLSTIRSAIFKRRNNNTNSTPAAKRVSAAKETAAATSKVIIAKRSLGEARKSVINTTNNKLQRRLTTAENFTTTAGNFAVSSGKLPSSSPAVGRSSNCVRIRKSERFYERFGVYWTKHYSYRPVRSPKIIKTLKFNEL